jgi:hypothetical protein
MKFIRERTSRGKLSVGRISNGPIGQIANIITINMSAL